MTIAFVVGGDAKGIAERLKARLVPDALIFESYAELRPHLPRIEGLITGTVQYKPEAVDLLRAEAKKLRWVQALSSGVDHHIDSGVPAGVTLTSASGAHAPAVADQALAAALSLLRRMPTFRKAAAENKWLKGAELPRQRNLDSTRCLVLGFGPIGAAVMRRLLGFDARVTVVSRTPVPLPEGVRHVPLADLDKALPEADLVFVCLPGVPDTFGILSRERLFALPAGAMVINVGRGSLIDEPALIEALTSGHLGGAGLDVTAVEPLPPDHPLWSIDTVEITPHVAGRGDRTAVVLESIIEDNVRRFLAGQELRNVAATGPIAASGSH
jgi:phosphoglycerate dehydrogenase-like enzyme